MPIGTPVGNLDIANATLRTSNLETQNIKIGSIFVNSYPGLEDDRERRQLHVQHDSVHEHAHGVHDDGERDRGEGVDRDWECDGFERSDCDRGTDRDWECDGFERSD